MKVKAIADAYLARLAADEAERVEREKPVTLEWWTTKFDTLHFSVNAPGSEQPVWFYFRGGQVRCDGQLLAVFGNRGQLLDLLRALGVEAKGVVKS